MPTRKISTNAAFEQHVSIESGTFGAESLSFFSDAPVTPFIQIREKIRDSHLNAHYASTSFPKPSLLDLHLISISSVATIATSASAKEESVK